MWVSMLGESLCILGTIAQLEKKKIIRCRTKASGIDKYNHCYVNIVFDLHADIKVGAGHE